MVWRMRREEKRDGNESLLKKGRMERKKKDGQGEPPQPSSSRERWRGRRSDLPVPDGDETQRGRWTRTEWKGGTVDIRRCPLPCASSPPYSPFPNYCLRRYIEEPKPSLTSPFPPSLPPGRLTFHHTHDEAVQTLPPPPSLLPSLAPLLTQFCALFERRNTRTLTRAWTLWRCEVRMEGGWGVKKRGVMGRKKGRCA